MHSVFYFGMLQIPKPYFDFFCEISFWFSFLQCSIYLYDHCFGFNIYLYNSLSLVKDTSIKWWISSPLLWSLLSLCYPSLCQIHFHIHLFGPNLPKRMRVILYEIFWEVVWTFLRYYGRLSILVGLLCSWYIFLPKKDSMKNGIR